MTNPSARTSWVRLFPGAIMLSFRSFSCTRALDSAGAHSPGAGDVQASGVHVPPVVVTRRRSTGKPVLLDESGMRRVIRPVRGGKAARGEVEQGVGREVVALAERHLPLETMPEPLMHPAGGVRREDDERY